MIIEHIHMGRQNIDAVFGLKLSKKISSLMTKPQIEFSSFDKTTSICLHNRMIQPNPTRTPSMHYFGRIYEQHCISFVYSLTPRHADDIICRNIFRIHHSGH